MIFYLQILGPNFGRTYLKDHEELAVHIKHACRVGVDPGLHQKVSHDVHPNGTPTQIFEKLPKSAIWSRNPVRRGVPLGAHTVGPFLGAEKAILEVYHTSISASNSKNSIF